MNWRRWLPIRFKAPLRRRWDRLYRWLRPAPDEAVKANTARAFNYFWAQKGFVTTHYLTPERVAFYQDVAQRCLDVLPAVAGGNEALRVLDVGCGPGHFLRTLRELAAEHRRLELHGFDFSAVAIRQARQLLPEAALDVRDIYQHRLPVGGFDLVTCLESLEHLADPDAAVERVMELARPGGVIVLTVPNGSVDHWDGHVNFWTPDEFTAWLRPRGLGAVELTDGGQTLLAVLRRDAANAGSARHAA
jgi:2-polyprenyl-3-methyl-5-hydroxy-6-metoxy-1,4-benzoquinol methylase